MDVQWGQLRMLALVLALALVLVQKQTPCV